MTKLQALKLTEKLVKEVEGYTYPTAFVNGCLHAIARMQELIKEA